MKPLLLTALCLLPFASYAQETTANGSLQTEASWTALQSRINATNGNVTILRTDVDAIVKCGKQNKVWNGTGCTTTGKNPVIRTIKVNGRIYAGTWSSCAVSSYSEPSNIPMDNRSCVVKPLKSPYKTHKLTSADVAKVLTSTASYKYFDHDDTTEWEASSSNGYDYGCQITCIRYE